VNVDSLKRVWWVSMAYAALDFLLVIMENHIPLRKELETELSMGEKAKSTKTDQCCSGTRHLQVYRDADLSLCRA
jgi:hypothetical protein